MKEDGNISWSEYLKKKSDVQLYVVIFTLLACSRLFDIYTTYLATPDLARESNFMVRFLGLGWFILIVLNILIIFVFFQLFIYSWSKLSRRYLKRQSGGAPYFGEYENQTQNPTIGKHTRPAIERRNVSLEIGITLPIYVIITGYFQGVVNLLVHLEMIIFSFINFLYLYPLIVGGVFGYISLYLTKKLLYLGHPKFKKKAHKVMMPKRVEEHERSA
jgi:hypothetical protein